jgi:hypothetical protein
VALSDYVGGMISRHTLDRGYCQCVDWHWIDEDDGRAVEEATEGVVRSQNGERPSLANQTL